MLFESDLFDQDEVRDYSVNMSVTEQCRIVSSAVAQCFQETNVKCNICLP